MDTSKLLFPSSTSELNDLTYIQFTLLCVIFKTFITFMDTTAQINQYIE
jgi:hypothetical protein